MTAAVVASEAARGARVVAEARRWVGTPYVEGAARRGAGADCVGLLRGVLGALRGGAPMATPAVAGAEPVLAGLAAVLRPAAPTPLRHGAVAAMRLRRGRPVGHVGVVALDGADGPTLIHAFSRRGVLESPLPAPWRARIAALFLFPEDV